MARNGMLTKRKKSGALQRVAVRAARLDERADFKISLREKAAIVRAARLEGPEVKVSDLYRRAVRSLIRDQGIAIPETDEEALAILQGE